ncbi:MAG TPA: immunoglobulin domain-containing protein [Phycisphaerae bacterium]|nr:immunoglobulin domain-containing protein [Phycisphaerae bacterium]HOJ75958.1 immunoglobulin domain-containing protein [Phycisphaerae bacterium]HOM53366.1 immunoglobulin domain-containing protein [Phycisphaerae bacterium]HPP28492.1 immunoglobulin domain-containing protein [Phycisphaerae bacterium]HPU26378.1 immunoglobulin domain-containing protein [Phycisphaerae bacterium]
MPIRCRIHDRGGRFKASLYLGSALACALWIAGASRAAEVAANDVSLPDRIDQCVGFDNPALSPDGKRVALSGENDRGVYVLDLATQTAVQVTDAPGSGYAFNWSPDGTRLGFKLLIPQTGGQHPMHQPCVYEVNHGRSTRLCDPATAAGVPSFAADGTVAFTVGHELRIVAPDETTQIYALGTYANLAPISPDGSRVAFNNDQDAIVVLDLRTGAQRVVTPPGVGCFAPVWSPDSSRLVVNTTGGGLLCVDADGGQSWSLGDGSCPSWGPDGKSVCYVREVRQEGVRLIESDLWCVRYDGSGRYRLNDGTGALRRAARMAPDGRSILYVEFDDGRVHQAALTTTSTIASAPPQDEGGSNDGRLQIGASTPLTVARITGLQEPIESSVAADSAWVDDPIVTGEPVPPGQVRLKRTCPYVHQVYDTPDAFNGHWACGATSAIMAIQYFEILPVWNVTVSVPYSHVSPFGQYVSAIYSFNGYTYNIGSPDPNGKTAYGGYGYIVRNNWADTKGYMRDYFIRHGVPSSVDWSPTWDELKAEIDADRPLVVLNSLTTAGHYITAIGYFANQRTAIFNDPYGNKNTPGYPSYDGAGAYYDWPGYSNGYQNLKTVHCFIYARGGQPPVVVQHPANARAGPGSTVSFSVTADGLGPLSYRWQKNRVDLLEDERHAGVEAATLVISGLVATDAGSYRCVIRNSYGSVTSNEAVLKVNSPDFDGDRDVDSEDFGYLQRCLSASGVPALPGCEKADLDGDYDVDVFDLARFQECYAGPESAVPSGCLN